jgi:hypothetical protein
LSHPTALQNFGSPISENLPKVIGATAGIVQIDGAGRNQMAGMKRETKREMKTATDRSRIKKAIVAGSFLAQGFVFWK